MMYEYFMRLKKYSAEKLSKIAKYNAKMTFFLPTM